MFLELWPQTKERRDVEMEMIGWISMKVSGKLTNDNLVQDVDNLWNAVIEVTRRLGTVIIISSSIKC